jgi:CRISPR/Cas system CMR-associated protein Cmr1 (group 7 of RAMP superfamily)
MIGQLHDPDSIGARKARGTGAFRVKPPKDCEDHQLTRHG